MMRCKKIWPLSITTLRINDEPARLLVQVLWAGCISFPFTHLLATEALLQNALCNVPHVAQRVIKLLETVETAASRGSGGKI